VIDSLLALSPDPLSLAQSVLAAAGGAHGAGGEITSLLSVPAIIALALMFAWIYQRTGSIVPNVVGHALNNSVAFMALYFAGSMP